MEQKINYFIQHFQKSYLNYWIVLGFDIFTAFACTWVAYMTVHYITGVAIDLGVMCKILIVATVTGGISAFALHTYRNTIRFAQLSDSLRLAGCAIIKSTCVAVAIWTCFELPEWHNSQKIVFVLFDGMLTLIVMAGFRVQMILTYEFLLNILNKKNMRILIYGADERSVALKIRLANSGHYKVIGFYIYREDRSRRHIASLPVYSFGNEKMFADLMRKKRIQGILFARYENTQLEENRLLQYCKKNDIKTLIAPDISGYVQSKLKICWVALKLRSIWARL